LILGLRDQLRDFLRKDDKNGGRGTWHSQAYHRFFEGYSEVSVPKPNRKGYTIQRVYTGDYYRQDLTGGQRLLVRGLYVALFLCIAYLFISTAVLPVTSNATWYVVLTQAVSIPFLFWILIVLFNYLLAWRDLTIYGYRSSSQALQKATLGASLGMGVVALAILVFMFSNLSNDPLLELLCAGKYLAAGLLALLMNRVEKKVHYLIVPSQNRPPINLLPIASQTRRTHNTKRHIRQC
jgi:hypothetical protein